MTTREQTDITLTLDTNTTEQIDYLVQEGLYDNRAEFIQTAIRKELYDQKTYTETTNTKTRMNIGVLEYDAEELHEMRANGKRLRVQLIGVLNMSDDVTPELAESVFEHIHVRGMVRIPSAVERHLTQHDILDY